MELLEKYTIFKNSHSKIKPLVLLNIWDQESAKLAKKAGATVLATSSYAIADHYGYEDGEKIPFLKLIEIIEEISNNTELAITMDIETGYAKNLDNLKENIKKLVEIGVIGINIEDKLLDGNLCSIKEMGEKIRAIKEVSKNIFINVRTDMFFIKDIQERNNNENILNETIERVLEYEKFGADGIFIPGLKNKIFIKEICKRVSIPVNLMLDCSNEKVEDFEGLGVSRFSFGPSIYLLGAEFYKDLRIDKNDIFDFLSKNN